MVEKAFASLCCVIVAHITTTAYSQELPCFNQKRLEKCSTEKGQRYQPKPVAVEKVDPNRTRP